jgi:hypothetical protein
MGHPLLDIDEGQPVVQQLNGFCMSKGVGFQREDLSILVADPMRVHEIL